MADSVAPPATDFETFFAAFLAQRPDSSRMAKVSGLVLERDAGRFALDEGDLWLATPVGERVCAAVYVGRGSFSLAPPLTAERQRLQQVFGVSTLERPFQALVFIAADSTIAELHRQLAFGPGPVPKEASTALDECLRYVSDDKSGSMTASLARPFLEGRANGRLFTLIDPEDGARLFYGIDPDRVEDVALWREPHHKRIGLWRVWRRDDVCMFPRAGAEPAIEEGDTRPPIAVRRHVLEGQIAGNMDFSATDRIEWESRETGPQSWVALELYHRLDVDSVAWEGGPPLSFYRGHESDQLWVRCEPPLAPGEIRTLRVSYHGRLIERIGDWMLMGESIGWYPEPAGSHRVPFDLTFHSPSQYHLVSVGQRVSSETRDGVATSRWVSDRPIHNATFVIGLFDEESFESPDGPPVTALMFRGKPEPIRITIGDLQIVSGARMDRKVAADAARAVGFFTRMLGPPPASRILVAEVPDTGGEAFPGLVRITWMPLRGRHVAARDAVFRSHEVAHQWWGYGVGHRTYRDHWLTEGFAEFSGLWYLQRGLGDAESYLAVLDDWRDQIFSDARFRPSGSPPPGAVALGYRAASIESPGDHGLIVYKKGAWVLHMLRTLLLDLETGADETFAALLRDFYARYEGGVATTEDFRRVAERYAGQDLAWFFGQWIHGTGLPSYRFASHTERTEDGRYRVSCRVEQSGVPAGFRMPVVVRIDFGDGRVGRVRVMVEGEKSEFDLPLLDGRPKEIVFNDLQSVLCRVERMKW